MKAVIIGRFTTESKENIRGELPADWELAFAAPEDAAGALPGAEVVIPEHVRVDAAFLDGAPELRLVQTGAGSDNVDAEECARRGVWVCSAAGVNAEAVAEHVMAFILCRYKNICALDSFMRLGGDEAELCYSGGELGGQTVGVVGLGAIGRRVAALCSAFGMEVLGYSRSPAEAAGVETVGLDELCARSDVVTLHVPLTPSTRHLIDRAALSRMKKSALLINTARGAVVDQGALIEALVNGEIGGACLDVFEEEPLPADSPLRALPNVILTPHTAGLPDGAKFHRKRCRFFVENIRRLMAGERPQNAVNRPMGR